MGKSSSNDSELAEQMKESTRLNEEIKKNLESVGFKI
jgi:hypothetical protein